MKISRLVLSLLCFLAAPAHAQIAPVGAPKLEVAFGKTGLSSLRYGGTEFLQNGTVSIRGVALQKWDGTPVPGDLKRPASFNEDKREVTWSYPWGTASCSY